MRKWRRAYKIVGMSKPKLSAIVIDKHPLMRTALSTAIDSVDVLNVVAEYAGISDVLTSFGSFFPNMILFGVGSPGSAELQLIPSLRSFFPSAQVLVLVTGEQKGQEELALRYGAHAVWQKTLSREDLINRVEKQFEKHFFHEENSNVQFQS